MLGGFMYRIQRIKLIFNNLNKLKPLCINMDFFIVI